MLSPERHRHHRHPPPPQPPPPPHHSPQPSHVVATIENLPAEGGSGGGRSGISAPSSSVRQRIRKVLNSTLGLLARGEPLGSPLRVAQSGQCKDEKTAGYSE
ncbi:unnamed protein product [Coccothraustes coccothraustes]